MSYVKIVDKQLKTSIFRGELLAGVQQAYHAVVNKRVLKRALTVTFVLFFSGLFICVSPSWIAQPDSTCVAVQQVLSSIEATVNVSSKEGFELSGNPCTNKSISADFASRDSNSFSMCQFDFNLYSNASGQSP